MIGAVSLLGIHGGARWTASLGAIRAAQAEQKKRMRSGGTHRDACAGVRRFWCFATLAECDRRQGSAHEPRTPEGIRSGCYMAWARLVAQLDKGCNNKHEGISITRYT
jgi:hypothetical protein